ncbi:hypothetical protein [Streptomyces sp. GS7]|nr:hypothetical protein [Streptomyces sp. GS7]
MPTWVSREQEASRAGLDSDERAELRQVRHLTRLLALAPREI